MGYDTRYTGRITIEPPLSLEEFEHSPFLPHKLARDLKLVVEEQPVATPDGTLFRRVGVAVAAAMEGPFTGYNIVEHLQEFVSAHGSRHAFLGHINCAGAEAGDIWRLRVEDGRAVRIKPRLVWPDEEEA